MKYFKIDTEKFPIKNIIGTIKDEDFYRVFSENVILEPKEYEYIFALEGEPGKCVEIKELAIADVNDDFVIVEPVMLVIPSDCITETYGEFLSESVSCGDSYIRECFFYFL